MTEFLKYIGIVIAALILGHWLTAGHNDILEGPPETPEQSSITSN